MVNYFIISISFFFLEHLYSFYLNFRQSKLLKNLTKIPEYCKDRITQEDFKKSQEYSKAKLDFKTLTSTIQVVTTFLTFYYPVYPYFWNISLELAEKIGYPNEIVRSCFFFVFTLGVSIITEIPFSYYYQFILEEKFGYNRMTIALFIKDKIISTLLMIGFGLPILSLAIYIINWSGPQLWFYCWLLLIAITLLSITIYPTFIQPLFNKFTPVDGEIAESIFSLAKRVGFPASKDTIFVVDNSKRDGHMNAYFYGLFGTKRIVLYDTLVKELDKEELLAVLGHEFGHYKMSHTLKQMLLVQVHLVTLLYGFSLLINDDQLYQQFGFVSSKDSVLVGLTLFMFLYAPIEHIFSLIINIFSRKYEFQADDFAVELGFLNSNHLFKLHFKELGCLVYDPLYSAYHHSHPTLVERSNNIDKKVALFKLKNK
ncbi:hypothetical protein ACTA71_000181 [Dictyostelium dimigraforme]